MVLHLLFINIINTSLIDFGIFTMYGNIMIRNIRSIIHLIIILMKFSLAFALVGQLDRLIAYSSKGLSQIFLENLNFATTSFAVTNSKFMFCLLLLFIIGLYIFNWKLITFISLKLRINELEKRPFARKDEVIIKAGEYIRGKKYITNKGYQGILKTHLEHTLVASEKLGRDLLSNEVVHHIDFDKLNNDKANLCVMDSLKHEQFHSWINWHKDKEGSLPTYNAQLVMLKKNMDALIL